MPVKMWCLLKEETGKPITIGGTVAFATRRDLKEEPIDILPDERIAKIELSDNQWKRLTKPKKVSQKPTKRGNPSGKEGLYQR